MDKGIIFNNGTELARLSELGWQAHPTFKGVFMKNMLSGKQTGQKLSTHMVRIEPFHEIGNHIHDGKAELHEVIGGEGTAHINNSVMNYTAGTVSYIPENVDHKIVAGETGLLILAKFTPALN